MGYVTTDAAVRELLHEKLGAEKADWLLYNALKNSAYHIEALRLATGGIARIDHMKRLKLHLPAGDMGQWQNEVLFLNCSIPGTVIQQAISQPLGKLVIGAGLEERIIKDIMSDNGKSQVILDHEEIADYDLHLSTWTKVKGLVARSYGRVITTFKEVRDEPPSLFNTSIWWAAALAYYLWDSTKTTVPYMLLAIAIYSTGLLAYHRLVHSYPSRT